MVYLYGILYIYVMLLYVIQLSELNKRYITDLTFFQIQHPTVLNKFASFIFIFRISRCLFPYL
jgi:hypothetical protein